MTHARQPREVKQSGREDIEAGVTRDPLKLKDLDAILTSLGVQYPTYWSWDEQDKSFDTRVGGWDNSIVTFHPHWSNGTAGVRGSKSVARTGISYWEIDVGTSVFGTSLMFGVSTKQASLHAENHFSNLIGEDEHGWGLSHRGQLYHKGVCRLYCPAFAEHSPVTVGILLDMDRGEVTFLKNGHSLGVAFRDLQDVQNRLYPTATSTAVRTVMTLGRQLRSFTDLKGMCGHVISSVIWPASCRHHPHCGSDEKFAQQVGTLPVPTMVKKYLCSYRNRFIEMDE